MYPVHDVDAVVLLALSFAAKRRPAELTEMIAAIDMAQGAVPPAAKLSQSIYRLSAYGLICAEQGGYLLAKDAQLMLSGQARKAKAPERLYQLREQLADYCLKGEHPALLVSEEQLGLAVLEHEKACTGKSLLAPKPAEEVRRQPYQPFGARRRRESTR